MPLLCVLACDVAGMRIARASEMIAMCAVRFIWYVVLVVVLVVADLVSEVADADEASDVA